MNEDIKIYYHRPTNEFVVGNPPKYDSCKVVRVRDVPELRIDLNTWENIGQARRRVELCGNKLFGTETDTGVCARCEARTETAGDMFAAFDAPLDQR